MKHTEFCYWLQGFFEINRAMSENVTLDEDAIKCIYKHIQLVKKHEGKLKGFTAWLEGVIDAGYGANDDGGVDIVIKQKIEDKLAEVFKHEIDNNYPNKNQLNQIHNPATDQFRC